MDRNPDVLIVDDDPAIRSSLRRGLKLEGFSVECADGGRSALDSVAQSPPDLIILDVSMPDLDGVEVAKSLRADGNDVPICILSARDEIDDRVKGLEAGADDYLVKPFALKELVARLNALLRRRPEGAGAPLVVGPLVVDPARHSVDLNGRAIDLTRREFALLATLARNPDVVHSRTQLLEMVWGYDFEVDTNVVDVFAGYLRRKLEADGEPRMIHTVRGVGFVLRP
jgi:DNA-binding response OmpR family regulator